MLKIGLIQLAVMEGRCQENMLHIKELAKKYAKDVMLKKRSIVQTRRSSFPNLPENAILRSPPAFM